MSAADFFRVCRTWSLSMHDVWTPAMASSTPNSPGTIAHSVRNLLHTTQIKSVRDTRSRATLTFLRRAAITLFLIAVFYALAYANCLSGETAPRSTRAVKM